MLKRMLAALAFIGLLAVSAPALGLEQSEKIYYTSDDAWNYTLVHTVTVENQASSYAFDIDIVVPLLDTALPLYNEKLGEQLLPYPDQVVTDEAGHREAHYHIDSLPGGSSLVLTQKYAVKVSGLSYEFDRAAVPDSYSKLELMQYNHYLQPEAKVQSTAPEIQAFKDTALAGETNPYRAAWALFAAVNQALAYEDAAVDDEGLALDAVATLKRGAGSCAGYTNLYLALLRAAGIPARQISGYLYMPAKHMSGDYVDPATNAVYLNKLAHVWVEFYLPDLGWVLADPTYTYTYQINGAVQKFVNWDYFANIGTSRRYIAFRNDSASLGKTRYSATGGWLAAEEIMATLVVGKDYLPFNDINGHWASAAIIYGVEQDFFTGVTPALFAPEQQVTRAMFITVLGRLYEARGGETIPYSSDITQFTDIRQEDYHGKYLGWALDSQLIEGYGQGRFGPDDPVTREQMAKILMAFLDMLEAADQAAGLPMPDFKDGAAISD